MLMVEHIITQIINRIAFVMIPNQS